MNDQDRISSYKISTISSRQVMRINKNMYEKIIGLSPNNHCKNYFVESRENY